MRKYLKVTGIMVAASSIVVLIFGGSIELFIALMVIAIYLESITHG